MKRLFSVLLIFIIVCLSLPITVFADDSVMLDGVIYSADMSVLINCTEKYSGGEEFSVPEGVREISAGAFLENTAIKKLYLPSSVEIIGKDAFRNSSVEGVYLQNSENLTMIDDCAFFDCKKLTNVFLFADADTDMGENVFKNCISLVTANLPDSLIPASAFIGCSKLGYVNLGKNETVCKTYGIGFMDSNGKVTASNARSILRLAADIDIQLANVHLSADTNRDGNITAADARLTLRAAANLETF